MPLSPRSTRHAVEMVARTGGGSRGLSCPFMGAINNLRPMGFELTNELFESGFPRVAPCAVSGQARFPRVGSDFSFLVGFKSSIDETRASIDEQGRGGDMDEYAARRREAEGDDIQRHRCVIVMKRGVESVEEYHVRL